MDESHLRKKKPSLIPKNSDGSVDHATANRLLKDLTNKLMTEQRAAERDNSMHASRTGRRDIVVHLAVTILPRVDGHGIIGEQEKEFGQWCFELPAGKLPCTKPTAYKAMAELAHIGLQALMKIGVIRG